MSQDVVRKAGIPATANTQRFRARRLYDSSIVALTHDHIAGIARWGETDEDLLEAAEAGVTVKALFIQIDALVLEGNTEDVNFEESLMSLEGFRQRAILNMGAVEAIVARHPDQLLIARTTADIELAKETGRCALLFAFEGAKPIEDDLGNLDRFHALGLRQLQLCWACPNRLCDRGLNNEGGRLTDFGREVIRRAEKLGIVIDPTHATDRIYYETLEECRNPIVCGHVSVRAPDENGCRYPGDMDEGRIRALAENGGVMGIHFWAHYLRTDRLGTAADIVDHIAFVADLAGIEHVALGPDYAHCPPSHMEAERHEWALTSGRIYHMGPIPDVDGPSKLPRVVEEMVRRGFGDDDIRKVLGGNYLRVLRQVIDKPGQEAVRES